VDENLHMHQTSLHFEEDRRRQQHESKLIRFRRKDGSCCVEEEKEEFKSQVFICAESEQNPRAGCDTGTEKRPFV